MFPPGNQPITAPDAPLDPQSQVPGQQPTDKREASSNPLGTQLTFSDEENDRLTRFIRENYLLAVDDNALRMQRAADQTRLWREKVGLPQGEEGKSNYRVQLTTALLLAKHARELDAMFGGGASVATSPRGPSDPDIAKRTSIAMSWKVFESMKAMKPIAVWALNRLKYGRAFAYVPHRTRFYSKFVNGKSKRVKYKSGPEVIPLEPDETIFPAEDPIDNKIEGFSWMIRQYWTTPAELLRDEQEAGLYSGVAEHWNEILMLARQGLRRDTDSDRVQLEKDWQQAVQRDTSPSIRNSVRVWEWYGRWRFEAAESEGRTKHPTEEDIVGAAGADEMTGDESNQTAETSSAAGTWDNPYTDGTFVDVDGVRRQMEEVDIVVRMLPELGTGLVVGIQRLDELFPETPRKWPILELSLLNDGDYWSMGLVELAEEIEQEMTVLINLLIESGQFGIKPLIFYEPSMAGAFETFKYEPGLAIPKAPGSKIDVVNITSNPEVALILLNFFKEQYGDLLGITATALGRQYSQQNAPRTLGQTRLFMGAADIRMALDMKMLSEDLKEFLEWVWSLWTMFGTEDEFFRVAEGKSQGAFQPNEIVGGFAKLGPMEREGRYDFSMNFADDIQTKEGKKTEALALMQAAMMTALVQNDPVAQYRLLVDVFKAFNLDFTNYANEPPPAFSPKTPEQEWTLALEGKELHVHPVDNDDEHEMDHELRVIAEKAKPEDEQDTDAIDKMIDHIIKHREQKMAKAQMAQLAAAIGGAVSGAMGGPGGAAGNPLASLLGGGAGGPGGMPGQSMGEMQ